MIDAHNVATIYGDFWDQVRKGRMWSQQQLGEAVGSNPPTMWQLSMVTSGIKSGRGESGASSNQERPWGQPHGLFFFGPDSLHLNP